MMATMMTIFSWYVTAEWRYGPCRLRVNDDDDDWRMTEVLLYYWLKIIRMYKLQEAYTLRGPVFWYFIEKLCRPTLDLLCSGTVIAIIT